VRVGALLAWLVWALLLVVGPLVSRHSIGVVGIPFFSILVFLHWSLFHSVEALRERVSCFGPLSMSEIDYVPQVIYIYDSGRPTLRVLGADKCLLRCRSIYSFLWCLHRARSSPACDLLVYRSSA